MTCDYKQIDQLDALYLAARRYPGSIAALAQRLGMSQDTLYKKLRPQVSSHMIGYEEASQVIELLEETSPDAADMAIQAFNWRHGRVAVKLPEAENAGDLMAAVLEVLSDEGKLAEDINHALSQRGHQATRSLAEIEADLQRCIAALCKVREEVRATFGGRK